MLVSIAHTVLLHHYGCCRYALNTCTQSQTSPLPSWLSSTIIAKCNNSPNDCCLCAQVVAGEGALHLCSAHPVPADVDDVIHTACDPVVAVCITPAAITCEKGGRDRQTKTANHTTTRAGDDLSTQTAYQLTDTSSYGLISAYHVPFPS